MTQEVPFRDLSRVGTAWFLFPEESTVGTTREGIRHRMERLAATVDELHQRQGCSITRLTVIKGLCLTSDDADAFAVHLSAQALKQLGGKEHRALASQVVARMRRYRKSRSREEQDALRELLWKVESVQNTYEPAAWGSVRIITSMPLLIIEYGLRCLLAPGDAAHWAYQAGRHYAERYDPAFGTGLIPRSAPLVEDIADFWCRHHLGQSLKAWRASALKAGLTARKQRAPRAARGTRRATRAPAPEPTLSTAALHPFVARWVAERGWIEIGVSEGSRSFIRALDEGGLIWEGRPSYPSLDAALMDLEAALARWWIQNG